MRECWKRTISKVASSKQKKNQTKKRSVISLSRATTLWIQSNFLYSDQRIEKLENLKPIKDCFKKVCKNNQKWIPRWKIKISNQTASYSSRQRLLVTDDLSGPAVFTDFLGKSGIVNLMVQQDSIRDINPKKKGRH